MGPPKPTFNFTIPSLHDNIPLDCRVYHPLESLNYEYTSARTGGKIGAIVAHPYAPLGGSYDDPVVELVAKEILRQGFVIGTFNFRGAGGSKGRTSWTAKAELADYISFILFFVRYLDLLQPRSSLASSSPSKSSSATAAHGTHIEPGAILPSIGALAEPITLIVGGYSYGSMITSLLPPIADILSRSSEVATGAAAAEGLLQARKLAGRWNKAIERGAGSEGGFGRASSIAMQSSHIDAPWGIVGRDERAANVRASIRERSRSNEGVQLTGSVMPIPSDMIKPNGEADIVTPRTHYLLISPLLPPISSFATFFSNPRNSKDERKHPSNLTTCPILAVYGSNDVFASVKKLRQWATKLATDPASQFRYKEVEGAGHFWREEGAARELRGAVREWARDVVCGSES